MGLTHGRWVAGWPDGWQSRESATHHCVVMSVHRASRPGSPHKERGACRCSDRSLGAAGFCFVSADVGRGKISSQKQVKRRSLPRQKDEPLRFCRGRLKFCKLGFCRVMTETRGSAHQNPFEEQSEQRTPRACVCKAITLNGRISSPALPTQHLYRVAEDRCSNGVSSRGFLEPEAS